MWQSQATPKFPADPCSIFWLAPKHPFSPLHPSQPHTRSHNLGGTVCAMHPLPPEQLQMLNSQSGVANAKGLQGHYHLLGRRGNHCILLLSLSSFFRLDPKHLLNTPAKQGHALLVVYGRASPEPWPREVWLWYTAWGHAHGSAFSSQAAKWKQLQEMGRQVPHSTYRAAEKRRHRGRRATYHGTRQLISHSKK